jgi:hypothetical protein
MAGAGDFRWRQRLESSRGSMQRARAAPRAAVGTRSAGRFRSRMRRSGSETLDTYTSTACAAVRRRVSKRSGSIGNPTASAASRRRSGSCACPRMCCRAPSVPKSQATRKVPADAIVPAAARNISASGKQFAPAGQRNRSEETAPRRVRRETANSSGCAQWHFGCSSRRAHFGGSR